MDGRVAVVTGGSRGIGAAICKALAFNGVRVAVCGRSDVHVQGVVDAIDPRGQARGYLADVTDEPELRRLRDEVVETLGEPDIVVACAGTMGPIAPITETEADEFRATLENNLVSTFLAIRVFAPAMISRGSGTVITVSSTAGRMVVDKPMSAAYSAAKAGVVQLTRNAAKELGQYGIRVNCLAPGTTLSERVQNRLSDEDKQRIADLSPIARLGQPDDIAHAALFLASSASAWITGATLDVTGGRVMS